MDNKKIIEYVKNHNLQELQNLIINTQGLDLRFTDNRGKTLLHHAVTRTSQNAMPMLQLLLEQDIDPNSLDEKFESATDIAKKLNNIPAVTILKYFINKQIQENQSYF